MTPREVGGTCYGGGRSFEIKNTGSEGTSKFVKNGIAELRVAEIPVSGHHAATATLSPGKRKIVVNVAAGGSAPGNAVGTSVPVKGVHIQGAHTIVGPHVQPVKGGKGARIVIKEGLWEERRGHKIDGGERRQAEVRAKKRGEEKRAR